MRVAVKFAYDGSTFNGYARQPKLKTVEGEVIKALIKYGIIEDTSESVFRSASRTDKGVSALSNIISFNTNVSKNSILQNLTDEYNDIIFYGIKQVEDDFNPRYAKMRWYRYYLLKEDFDFDIILSTAAFFTGTHNFSNFARVESFREPIRTIDNIIFTIDKDYMIVDFFAQNFLWQQIRRIISALIKVGFKKIEKEHVAEALNNPNKKIDYGLATATPLILKDIIYEFDFEYYKNLLKKADELEKNHFRILRFNHLFLH
jgi:tRNA pseudouridine38-40 synthase